MSKSFKSRLTGSGRKRVRRSRRRPPPKRKTGWIDALDAIDERCNRIETLAGLLYACTDPGAMDARLASNAGYFIQEAMREVKGLLDGLAKGKSSY